MKKYDREMTGARLRIERRRLKESQADAAKAIGVTPASYASYETGERVPRDDVKIRIAEHFSKTVGELFFAEYAHLE